LKIYTRTGDSGETALFGGGRVPKDHPRVRAYGTVDELNSVLGRALAAVGVPASRERLARVQHDLFAVGSLLATPPAREGRTRPDLPPFPEGRIQEMEAWMDEAEETLPPLKAFILPGGSPGASELHVCRTVCRRAERAIVEVAGESPDAADAIRYLNRLSDLLFVLARLENRRAGVEDVRWEKGRLSAGKAETEEGDGGAAG
jgi:cob(I)alamin adenosyltransferase